MLQAGGGGEPGEVSLVRPVWSDPIGEDRGQDHQDHDQRTQRPERPSPDEVTRGASHPPPGRVFEVAAARDLFGAERGDRRVIGHVYLIRGSRNPYSRSTMKLTKTNTNAKSSTRACTSV